MAVDPVLLTRKMGFADDCAIVRIVVGPFPLKMALMLPAIFIEELHR
jgi:hypothetical protein